MNTFTQEQAGFDFCSLHQPQLHHEFQHAVQSAKAINIQALTDLREVDKAFLQCLSEPSELVLAEDFYRRADAALVAVRTRRQHAIDALETPLLLSLLDGLKARLLQEQARYDEEKLLISSMRMSKKKQAAYQKAEDEHTAVLAEIDHALNAAISGIPLHLRHDSLSMLHIPSAIRSAVTDAAREGSALADAFGAVNALNAQAWNHVSVLRRAASALAAARQAESFLPSNLEACIDFLAPLPLPDRIVTLAEFNPMSLTLDSVRSYPSIGTGSITQGFGRNNGKFSATFDSSLCFEDEQGRLRSGLQCKIGLDGKLTISYGALVEAWVRHRDRNLLNSAYDNERAFLVDVCKEFTKQRGSMLGQGPAAAIIHMIRGGNDSRAYYSYAFAIRAVSNLELSDEPADFVKAAFKDYCDKKLNFSS